jgi:endonuclease-8
VPEGDTIHRVADRLRPALVGRRLVRFEVRRSPAGPRPRPGELITSVEARGKHLLVTFERRVTLETHLGMNGSWHLYRRGERWRRPAHLARAVVEVDDGWLAVCFSAPLVRSWAPSAPSVRLAGSTNGVGSAAPVGGTGPAQVGAPAAPPVPAAPLAPVGPLAPNRPLGPAAHLGPDLCDVAPDLDEVLRRAAALLGPDVPACDLLLDQRVAAGIGNVYKSEVLWACGVHPLVPLGRLDDGARRRLFVTAHRLLRANLRPGRRVTHAATPGGQAVYRRSARPCPRCGTPIEWDRLGRHARSTYWCPRCQPPVGSPAG